MNCETCRDRLLELVYDELGVSERSAVEQHLSGCPACREEFDKLRFARAALAHGRAREPKAASAVGPRGEHPRLRRWVPMAVGAAAAGVILTALFYMLGGPGVPEVQARPPVEIVRKGVSLTVLSEPPRTRRTAQGYTVRYARWRGLALVRDRRLARHLPEGVSEVRFTNVPAGIRPDSVRLFTPDAPGRLTILEQNYQYDLASATAVLDRHVDRQVTLRLEGDGGTVTGTLLAHDNESLVIRPTGEGPRSVPREVVTAVTLGELPEGLLTRPTLVWRLRNAAASRQRLEVNYLTEGLTWRADYVLKLRGPAEGATPPELVDAADFVGYATVTNESGVTYEDAKLKLMAGDVNLIRKPVEALRTELNDVPPARSNSLWQAGFEEKSFFEYHLYTLGRPATLRDRETKQIELTTASGVKLRRRYVFNFTTAGRSPTERVTQPARVVSELKNSEANGLGRPLPKGVVRLYAPDPTGVSTYVGQTEIDHTPKDETLRLKWGRALDLLCERRLVDAGHRGNEHSRRWEYVVRNHKSRPVAVTILTHVPKSTYAAECDDPWHVREVGLVEIDLTVGAGATKDVEFSLRYNTESGGGLTSPYDGPSETNETQGT